MICRKCGEVIADDAKFCVYCGTQVITDASPSINKATIVKTIKKHRRTPLIGIVIGICIALVLGGIILNLFLGKTKIDAMSFLSEPTFEGYDGHGSLLWDYDFDKVPLSPHGNSYMSLSGDDYYSFLEPEDKVYMDFWNKATFVAEPEMGLSNDDKVTITFKYDEAMAKALGYRITNTTKEFTVSGLEKPFTKDQITEENLNTLKSLAEKRIKNDYSPEDYKALSLKHIKSYYTVGSGSYESDEEYYSDNSISMIYEVSYKLEGWDGEYENETEYVVVYTDEPIDSNFNFSNASLSLETAMDCDSAQGAIKYFEDYITSYDTKISALD